MSPMVASLGAQASFGMLPAGAFESIATVTVGSGGAASLDFLDIPSGFSHLQVRLTVRSTRATDPSDYVGIRFNNDSTTTYRRHTLAGNGSSATALSDTATYGYIHEGATASGSSTNIFGADIIDILDYGSTSKNKVVRTLSGWDSNGNGVVSITSVLWPVTNAISRITLISNANYAQYSTAALYGMR